MVSAIVPTPANIGVLVNIYTMEMICLLFVRIVVQIQMPVEDLLPAVKIVKQNVKEEPLQPPPPPPALQPPPPLHHAKVNGEAVFLIMIVARGLGALSGLV